MTKYLSNQLSLKEAEELLEWIEADPTRGDLLKELQETWDKTKDYPENLRVDTRAAWHKLRSNIKAQEQKEKKNPDFFPFPLIVVLATVLLCSSGFLGYYYYLQQVVTLKSGPDEKRELALPDGSKVWLNGGSTLRYAREFNDEGRRTIQLKGEAFFDVVEVPGTLFVIESSTTLIQAPGGTLNVRQDSAGAVRVSVTKGSAFIKRKDEPGKGLLLSAGETGRSAKSEGLTKFPSLNENFLYWKTGKLSFVNVSLAEVLKTLECVYRVRFSVNDSSLLKQRLVMSVNHPSLQEFINLFQTLLGVNIKRKDSVYYISRKIKKHTRSLQQH